MENELPGITPPPATVEEKLKLLWNIIVEQRQKIEDLEADMLQLNKHMREFDESFEKHVQFDLFEKKGGGK
jgi:uncharacterized coiled-coil protein SlyX